MPVLTFVLLACILLFFVTTHLGNWSLPNSQCFWSLIEIPHLVETTDLLGKPVWVLPWILQTWICGERGPPFSAKCLRMPVLSCVEKPGKLEPEAANGDVKENPQNLCSWGCVSSHPSPCVVRWASSSFWLLHVPFLVGTPTWYRSW